MSNESAAKHAPQGEKNMNIEVVVKDNDGNIKFSELVARVPEEELFLPSSATIGMASVSKALSTRSFSASFSAQELRSRP
jgi:hypothetical protein